VVGRGLACEITREVLGYLMKNHPYHYECTTCKSFNKYGRLVDEMHVIISATGATENKYAERSKPQRYTDD